MSRSPVCRNSPLADAVVAQAVLPLSPSFTGRSIPRDRESLSIDIIPGQEGSQHSPILPVQSFDLVDLTVTHEEAEPDPAAWNVHSSSDPQPHAVDLTEDLQHVLSDSQSSSLSLNEMAEATLGVPAPLDLIQELQPCDNVLIPKRYRKESSQSFQFAAIDLTSDSLDEKSEYIMGSYTSPLPSGSPKSTEPTISSINFPTSTSKIARDRADVDAPMPRICQNLKGSHPEIRSTWRATLRTRKRISLPKRSSISGCNLRLEGTRDSADTDHRQAAYTDPPLETPLLSNLFASLRPIHITVSLFDQASMLSFKTIRLLEKLIEAGHRMNLTITL